MNYMTPDLLIRLQDESTADGATDQWMNRVAEYEKRLRAIREHMPRGARILAFRHNPHDAQVTFVGFGRDDSSAHVILKLDEPGHRILVLEYDLVKKPEWTNHPALADFGGPTPLWLYDEFDEVEEHDVRFLTHSILFSNGQELKLSFRQMRCKAVERYAGLMTGGDAATLGGRQLQPV